mmetsp:Transcript_55066/g.98222  ORF Transcript_55066/g.98222 Transcript_55066/m.98222 type:complete len:835 (-) Transcript_55066:72-2576(-)|eukprot:CAMPEP_0197628162 /NCGR_PEP_ID=MMETSP1338-20131121/6568_1 /TAXON_ID=43686 ORGANISM="Pelagodinium beii, Strain RCC1491" /NCGR_SAMPLE_ID=MMETSP1338 /ASSEMBLY_ACC=CAM_ASM_000754 /LENGTH=834 /DNA_ID=CAMNT_0043199091 /DNA_START=53 /DNA_END=2557 /DNA_ORIENTATION=-
MGHLSNGFDNSGLSRPASAHWRGPKGMEPSTWTHHDDHEWKVHHRHPVAEHPSPGLFLLILTAAVSCLVFIPTEFEGANGASDLPHTITSQVASDLSALPLRPALRGCCGEPAEFRWLFLERADEAVAGQPFRTRLVARDSKGRQARPAACGALRVGLDLSGRAHLSKGTLPSVWRNSELELHIENELAEVVQAEVRIESPDPEADVLLHTSQIRFASGPTQSFSLRVESEDSEQLAASGSWPIGRQLVVTVSTQDRFGNPTPKSDLLGGGNLHLRSSAGQSILEMRPSGALTVDSSGEAHATIRGLQTGTVEIWLEQVGGNVTGELQRNLRSNTVHAVSFEGRSEQAPTYSTPSAALAAARLQASKEDLEWQDMADKVKGAFLSAWQLYERHAWGKDELQPVSKKGRNTFGGLGLTILDSLSTLWVLGLDDEFNKGLGFVRDDLDFDRADSDVSVFELTIRGLGGLLGAHTVSGNEVFLERAKELGNRLLPAFKTPSKLPLPALNIARGTGHKSTQPVILSEAGSVQLEFRSLAARTGDQRFKQAADLAFKAIQSSGMQGILPVYLTPPDTAPAQAVQSKYAFGALADSYYEYLLKQWLQSPSEKQFKDIFLQVMDALPSIVRPLPSSVGDEDELVHFKMIEIAADGSLVWKMDHLSCFAPALIALGLMELPKKDLQKEGRNSTWWRLAEGLTASCAELWTSTPSGLAPEFSMVDQRPPHKFIEASLDGRHSFIRPETAESLFYLYRLTGNEKYRRIGKKMFLAIDQHTKVNGGFSSVRDVKSVPTSKMDEMQTFVMAETFKYLFLLFSPTATFDMHRYVLNTEGHPLTRAEL